jgi:hypothetical protein
VASDEPPVLAAYQLIVPPFDVAARLTAPEPQTEPPEVVLITGGNCTLIAITARYPEPV